MLGTGKRMLYRNINKKSPLVIFWLVILVSIGCGPIGVSRGTPPKFDLDRSDYGKPQTPGRVRSGEIEESSGVAASRCQPNILWTHNDSGDGPYVFAMDGTGRDLGTWKIENAENIDWEDIAEFKDANGKCFLYLGDTGNSRKEPRTTHQIYRVAEPTVPEGGAGSTRKAPLLTSLAEAITFSYPDGPHDAEALMVHPETGEIYLVTKSRDTPAGVYKFAPFLGGQLVRPEKIANITVPAIPNGFLTGGDIAPDGRRLVLCDYFAGYELALPSDAKSFDEIWKQKPAVIDLDGRNQGEAIGYSSDGRSLFATSEGKDQPLIRVDQNAKARTM